MSDSSSASSSCASTCSSSQPRSSSDAASSRASVGSTPAPKASAGSPSSTSLTRKTIRFDLLMDLAGATLPLPIHPLHGREEATLQDLRTLPGHHGVESPWRAALHDRTEPKKKFGLQNAKFGPTVSGVLQPGRAEIWRGPFRKRNRNSVCKTSLIKMHANFCRRNGTALPSLQTRFDYHTLVMFYKIHTKQAPSYLTSLLPPLSSRSGYTLRKLSYRFPTVSRTSTLNSFLPRAVALWNALPTNVQQGSSIYTFKKLLQSHLKI